MSTRKNKSNRRTKSPSSSKRYTPEQRISYHTKRDTAHGHFGLTFGEPKHTYSIGYVDGALGKNNKRVIKAEYGAKSSYAYEAGHKRGAKAGEAYFKKTGKHPSSIVFGKK